MIQYLSLAQMEHTPPLVIYIDWNTPCYVRVCTVISGNGTLSLSFKMINGLKYTFYFHVSIISCQIKKILFVMIIFEKRKKTINERVIPPLTSVPFTTLICIYKEVWLFSWKFEIVLYTRLNIKYISGYQLVQIEHFDFNISITNIIFVCERECVYSISQEICTRFLLCCALLWLYIDWFSHIHQAYLTGTVAI